MLRDSTIPRNVMLQKRDSAQFPAVEGGGGGKEEGKFIMAAPLIPRAISPNLIEFPKKYACARAD